MTQEIAMLHDMTRCTACRGCMVACKQWHDLPPDMSTPFEGQYQSHKDLTSRVYTLIEMKERVDKQGKFQEELLPLRRSRLRKGLPGECDRPQRKRHRRYQRR